jgi:hypothetical protein
MPQYLMSVCFADDYSSEFDRTDPDVVRTSAKIDALNEEMSERNIWLFVGGLRPASEATVVRADGARVVQTDGPFVETKEQIGGIWVIDVPDLDTALEWAAKATVACERPIEIRPFHA